MSAVHSTPAPNLDLQGETQGQIDPGLVFDPSQGLSAMDMVRGALASNLELQAARLDLERSRARLRQAGLRPNPSIDVELTTGRYTGSDGEKETAIGFSLPLELFGQRGSRMDLARAEVEATQAEIAERERRLTTDVLTAYAEALAALRELRTTNELNSLDLQTARIVEARVTEGESPPLELSLFRVEIDRLRSRRTLLGGRLQSALIRLKGLAGIPAVQPLRLSQDLTTMLFPEPPASLETAIEQATQRRPDLQLARLTERVAMAGLRLAQAQARPDLAIFSRFMEGRAIFDDTPVGPLRDRDRLIAFGLSFSLPVWNRNQGAKAEAEIAIQQARKRREFIESMVRVEVASAYTRYQAATAAVSTFEQSVITRSQENIQAIRGAYEIGAFRLTELLAEQRRLVDSEREFTEVLFERYRALADFQSAIGGFTVP